MKEMKPELESQEKRRVLLMYISKVSGHRQATIAIQQALRQLDVDIEAPTVNGFGQTFPVLEKVVNEIYMCVIRTVPQLWEWMYDNQSFIKNTQFIKNFIFHRSQKKIERLIKRYNPDTVVCTQAFPCGMMANYKQKHNLNFKLIGVLTDFAPHSFWINEGVDYYVVPSEDTKDQFVKKGLNPDAIKVYGIPLRSRFSEKLNKQLIAESLNLNPRIPTVLIMGGGQGLGPIYTIVEALNKIQKKIQIICIAGTNKNIVDKLKKYAQNSEKKLLVYEYVSNVDELMELASVIVTKPGGMTTTESLTKGLPMVIVNPIPGQEMCNTEFLIKKGIGIHVEDIHQIGYEIEELLNSEDRTASMSKAAYKNSKPYAAVDLAKFILNQDGQKLKSPFDDSFELEEYV